MSYEDLLQNIQTAQRDAGEQAVIAHLRSQGLIDSEQNQPPAGTEPASSATKTIAQFTHIYRDPITPFNAPHLRRFCEPSLNLIGLGVVAPVGLNAAIVELQIHDGSTIVNASMQLDADNLETAARHFLDAAHHLRQQASQGGAA